MKLTSSRGESIENLTNAEIRAVLEVLDLERDGEGFAILDGDDSGFL